MNVFYAFDNNFLPQSATSICSLCENNKNFNEINIYIASYKISEINKEKLKKLVKKYNRNLTIIELGDLSKYFDFEFDSSGWPPVTLARLVIDKLLPSEVDKILYLDSDVIVRRCLDELWDVDMKDNVLAMSIEPTVDKERKTKIGLNDYPYYNAGVMLMNLDKWRKTKACQRIFDFFKSFGGKLFAADQDAINGTLKDEIYTLSPAYNSYNIFYQYPYKFMKKLMGNIKYVTKGEYTMAIENPYIVHFLGEERPWRVGNTHKFKSEYNYYLSKTEWCNAREEEGWKIYFLCWKIFNFVTRPIPGIRYKIISYLIPKFISFRAKKRKKSEKIN